MVLSTMIFNAVITNEDFEKVVVDLILDEYIQLPKTIGDMFSITNLDLVSTLSTRFPAFRKRLTVPTISKMMVERGYETTRKGPNRLSCYIISKRSKVLELLENDSQTWQLIVEPFVENVCKNNMIKNLKTCQIM